MYAGNVGFSQSLELVLAAARRCPRSTFVINGDGAARAALETRRRRARQRALRRLPAASGSPEVLATGDVHVVPLQRGPGARQRAVEDVLDPGRRPSGRRRDRRRHRGAADPGRVGRRRGGAARRPGAFVARPCARCSPTRPRRDGDGRGAGAVWVERAASPARRRRPPTTRSSRLRCAALNPLRSATPDSLASSWHPHSSSTKKVAKLAQRARARRSASRAARCSRSIVAIVVVLGLALIVYARQSRPGRRRVARRPSATTGTPRTASTSATRGCQLTATRKRARPAEPSTRQRRVRPHRHPQPRRRRHPLPPVHPAAVGKRAKLGVFLDVYDVELTRRQARVPRGPAAPLPEQPRTARRRRARRSAHRRRGRGRRDQGRRVGQLHRHRRRHDVHHRPRRHPRQPGRHGVRRSRSSPTDTDVGDAAVGGRTCPTSAPPTAAGHRHHLAGATTSRSDDRAAGHGRTGHRDRQRPTPRSTTDAATTTGHGDDVPATTGDHGRLMRAVVLVGGFGTRLRPLTYTSRSRCCPVGHEPIIERLVDNLARGGVTDVTLALGFRPEPFLDAFPDGRCGGVDAALRGRARAARHRRRDPVRRRAAGIDDTFVVANGDVLTDLDVAALVALHRASAAAGDDPPDRRSTIRRRSVSSTLDDDGAGRARSSRSRRRAPSRAT